MRHICDQADERFAVALDPLAVAATALAVAALEVADLGWQPPWLAALRGVALLAAALAARFVLARLFGGLSRRAVERAVFLAVIVPVAWRVAWQGVPTDAVLREAARNIALALLALPARPGDRIPPAAGMTAGVAVVLACSVGEGKGPVMAALIVAAVLVVCAALARRGSESSSATGLTWGTAAAVGIVGLGTALAAAGVHDRRALALLAGRLPAWVNSSGGDLRGHDLAGRGLGDGPDQVAGADGAGGFDAGEFFSETSGACLYDAIIESYGESAAAESDVAKLEQLKLDPAGVAPDRGRDLRAGRERDGGRRFDLRRKPAVTAEPKSDGGEVMWVEADLLPLRLPLTAFDAYDGGVWREEADQRVNSAMDNADAGGWFEPVDQPVGASWGEARRITVRLGGTFVGNVLPLPGGMTRFRMGRLTRADLFASAKEPMLRANRQDLPPGSVIEAEYRPTHRAALADAAPAEAGRRRDSPAAAALADEFAGGLPRGWPQIDAVVRGLRDYAVYDPSFAAAPLGDVGDGCPVERFLRETRRGDAYLFASSAVLMLRSLGYDVRLAGGFYVDAGSVDPATGQAAVTRRDAHVWPQARLALEAGAASSGNVAAAGIARGGQWVDLEPTPGFALADGAATTAQRLAAARRAASAWVRGHALMLVALGLALTAVLLLRRRILDVADAALWHLRLPLHCDRGAVMSALRLLDRRAARAGARPPAGTTWPRRLRDLSHPELASAADWALHAPASIAAPHDVRPLCRRAVCSRIRVAPPHPPAASQPAL